MGLSLAICQAPLVDDEVVEEEEVREFSGPSQGSWLFAWYQTGHLEPSGGETTDMHGRSIRKDDIHVTVVVVVATTTTKSSGEWHNLEEATWRAREEEQRRGRAWKERRRRYRRRSRCSMSDCAAWAVGTG